MDLDQVVREDKAIHAVNDRLRRSFADRYSGDVVTHTVQKIHHRFDGRPIREFVPVLVERFAREELRTSVNDLAAGAASSRQGREGPS
jgi:hypothetical protein